MALIGPAPSAASPPRMGVCSSPQTWVRGALQQGRVALAAREAGRCFLTLQGMPKLMASLTCRALEAAMGMVGLGRLVAEAPGAPSPFVSMAPFWGAWVPCGPMVARVVPLAIQTTTTLMAPGEGGGA